MLLVVWPARRLCGMVPAPGLLFGWCSGWRLARTNGVRIARPGRGNYAPTSLVYLATWIGIDPAILSAWRATGADVPVTRLVWR